MARRILIVDDEPSILRSTSLLLEGMGYEVVSTGEAGEVLDLALKERPDVILQDVRMPGLEIETLVRKIREQPTLRGTHIVLFSAGMDTDQIAGRVGVTRWVEKPFKPEEIERALEAPAP